MNLGLIASALAMQKQSPAPTMALNHDSAPPQKAPNRAAFARVIRKAGSGATIAWRIISANETSAACGPQAAINPLTCCGSREANAVRLCCRKVRPPGNHHQAASPATATTARASRARRR